ncbi:Lrp/AsnC family transcriptional regulator [Nocardia pseudovaccinii]|uniref:Lrp/AsnC family transcriptional regulator n=1 Tax=Nocardia pseudovaccinii TaxID=189540 RepID=UPI0007A520B0|nr:Lrp/AsnC family transcriptional regulator [Nocardia pseudovaccinii]
MDSIEIDHLDRQLLHALQLDGRAPFNRVASALGVSEHTVGRRYRRLRTSGLFVVGEPDSERLGYTRWLLRIRCTPDAVTTIADALGRRADTSHVSVASGGTEVHCSITTHSAEEADAILLSKLPRTPRMVSFDAHCVLRTFCGTPPSWYTKQGALDSDQATALMPPTEETPRDIDEVVVLDAADHSLMSALAVDGRATFPQLTAATGISASSLSRHLDRLRAVGALHICLDYPPARLGYQKMAKLWLRVAPGELESIGETLGTHPETDLVAATTGPFNLVATVICRNAKHLYVYLNNQIGALSGVQSVETAPLIREVKRLSVRR